LSLQTFHIGPFYFPPHLLTKGENKTALLKFTERTLHYPTVSPANSILVSFFIIVKPALSLSNGIVFHYDADAKA